MKYPKTITSLVLFVLFGLMSYVVLSHVPKSHVMGVIMLFLAGFFAGQMAKSLYCERFHDRKWYRQMLDEEFDKAVLIRQAEQIVRGSGK